MSNPLNQIEVATTLIARLQQANDDGMVPIHMLGTTISEVNALPEIRACEQHNRQALLALAAAARNLITMIEEEEARWLQSDSDLNPQA